MARFSNLGSVKMARLYEEIKGQVWLYGENRDYCNDNTVMIMSGIHPEEEAGVFCVNMLINDIEWLESLGQSHVIMIPCRNKLGFSISDSFRRNEEDVSIIIENKYCKILKLLDYENNYILIPKREMIVKNNRESKRKKINDVLKQNIEKGFVHIISLRKGNGIRANGYYYNGNRLIDLNAVGEYPNISYICDIEKIINKYNPNIVIDLHEGKGKEVYLYIDSSDETAVLIGKKIIEHINRAGADIRKNASDRKKIADGLFALESLTVGKKMLDMVGNGKVVVVEVGIDNEIQQRIDLLTSIVKQSVNLFRGCISYERE